MLVLSRKLGEFLVLNDNIFISVFEGGVGDQVKIAIEAPEDVKIARSEMFADCEEVQKKLEAIRSRKVGKRTKRTRKEMERLGTVKTSSAEGSTVKRSPVEGSTIKRSSVEGSTIKRSSAGGSAIKRSLTEESTIKSPTVTPPAAE